ncbi:MAG: hypothetical protein Q8J74_14915 [Candidatus Didemnitutus sp.]|nr:hypothetical protein [Candidatus Didemnitutus sp.]
MLSLLATAFVQGREQPAAPSNAPGSDRTERQFTQTYHGIATAREILSKDGPDLLGVDSYPWPRSAKSCPESASVSR